MWLMVYGFVMMLLNKIFIYKGDYFNLVENILRNNFVF